MNVLKQPIPAGDDALVRQIGIRVCKFANGECDCHDRGRHRLCARAETVAACIVQDLHKSGERT